MSDFSIQVEYCGGWGNYAYYVRYANLRRRILESLPNATVEGEEGGRGRFEVYINGRLYFSKFRTQRFPNIDDVNITIKSDIHPDIYLII